MIIEKKNTVATGDIIGFRVVTGEELIGKVVSVDDKSVTVTRPVVIQMQMVAPNQAGIAFAPFMVTAEEDGQFTIAFDKMLTMPFKARRDIAANYYKATTGIDLPNSAPTASGLLRA